MPKHAVKNKSFNTIYAAESEAIFRFCLIRVSDRERALDLTQETFVRLWQTLQGDAVMTNTRSFLFTVAHHLIIDWYRKKKSLSLESLMADNSSETYEPLRDGVRQELELEAEGRYLIDKIASLSSSYQHVVHLRFVEGLTPPQIAAVLGISANAASVRINRGIQELRKLTGYEIIPGNTKKDPKQ